MKRGKVFFILGSLIILIGLTAAVAGLVEESRLIEYKQNICYNMSMSLNDSSTAMDTIVCNGAFGVVKELQLYNMDGYYFLPIIEFFLPVSLFGFLVMVYGILILIENREIKKDDSR